MERKHFQKDIGRRFKSHPIVAILGPRQCGKTTLSKQYIQLVGKTPVTTLDLEDPRDLAKLENPMLALESKKGLVIIDEIQRRPDLFPILRVLVDNNKDQKFLILGSASRELIRQGSESLAGRISYMELTPFQFSEVKDFDKLWFRGGFPKSFLGASNEESQEWLKNYVRTFLEQDIPNLGLQIPSHSMGRFWRMLAHYHGQIFNASEIGKSLGVSHVTAQRYLDILTGTFMIRSLKPWFENMKKRQVKMPKIYFRDAGVFHYLSGIQTPDDLYHHVKLGASWEAFVLDEIIRKEGVDNNDCYFWAIHEQAKLDLLMIKNGKRIGFEIKYTDAPTLNRSLIMAFESLKLDALTVIYPGKDQFKLNSHIEAIGFEAFISK
ncbi:MAG: ATP-binding protein [Candidatus Margulisbacteria bacterium]|nr:ATP-binding protein [Candidatus Margulisiibacteriota bacterium]